MLLLFCCYYYHYHYCCVAALSVAVAAIVVFILLLSQLTNFLLSLINQAYLCISWGLYVVVDAFNVAEIDSQSR